jgi:hypothetical protein
MANRQPLARVPRRRSDQSLDRSRLAGSHKATVGLDITDDFSESIAISDREFDAIETYLAASLKEMLGRLD